MLSVRVPLTLFVSANTFENFPTRSLLIHLAFLSSFR